MICTFVRKESLRVRIEEKQATDFLDLFLESLLSGTRNAREADLAREIMLRISQLFPGYGGGQISAAILLANTVASSGDLEEASTIRWNLSQSGAKKIMGLSWTEIDGEILVNDNVQNYSFHKNLLLICFSNFMPTIDHIQGLMKSTKN